MSAKKNRQVVTNAPLRDVVIFSLPITLWSGRGKLAIDDLGIDEKFLPPEALASLGSKRLISKEALKPLERVKRKMIRVLASTGIRFLTGYAHAHATANKVAKELDKLVKEGEAARAEFIKDFDADARKWQEEFPDWSHIIAAALPSKESLASRITFGYQCFVAGTPEDLDLADRLNKEASGLAGTLWAEVEFEAMDFVKKSFGCERNSATQRTIKPIYRMLEKLDRLSFLDHRVGPFVDVMNDVMAAFPAKGTVSDSLFLVLVRVGHILADKFKMQEIGQQVYDGLAVADAVSKIVGAASADLTLTGQAASQRDEPIASISGDAETGSSGLAALLDLEGDDLAAAANTSTSAPSRESATEMTAAAHNKVDAEALSFVVTF